MSFLGYIDFATIRDLEAGPSIFIEGWIVCPSEKLLTIELQFGNHSALLKQLNIRKDVAERLTNVPNALYSGFKVSFPISGDHLPNHLSLRAVTATKKLLQGSIPIHTISNSLDEVQAGETFFGDLKSRQDIQTELDLELSTFLASSDSIEFKYEADVFTSIIIICWNQAAATLRCLRHLSSSRLDGCEIILVNNNSTDQTALLLQKVTGLHTIHNQDNLHFISAANAASLQARGETLLFLNNDCFVEEETVCALQNAFRSLPNIGAVGGKLLRVDRSLQEAGGIVWGDGATSGYGLGDDPSLPDYNFRRPVDYSSGALLLVQTAAFRSLGGFSPIYNKGYYEDVDLCFRLRSLGYEVIFEPTAVALHIQSLSAKPSSILEHQKSNRLKFCKRFKQVLNKRPYTSVNKDRQLRSTACSTDRILVLHKGGGEFRDVLNYQLCNLLEWLIWDNFEVSLLTLSDLLSRPTTLAHRIEHHVFGHSSYLVNQLRQQPEYYGAIILLGPSAVELYYSCSPPSSFGGSQPVLFSDQRVLPFPQAVGEFCRLPNLSPIPSITAQSDSERSNVAVLINVDSFDGHIPEIALGSIEYLRSSAVAAPTVVIVGDCWQGASSPFINLVKNPSVDKLVTLLSSHQLAIYFGSGKSVDPLLLSAVSARTPLILGSAAAKMHSISHLREGLIADTVAEITQQTIDILNNKELQSQLSARALELFGKGISNTICRRQLVQAIRSRICQSSRPISITYETTIGAE